MTDRQKYDTEVEEIASPSEVKEELGRLGVEAQGVNLELPITRVSSLVDVFSPFIAAANEWIEEAKKIEVVDERDTESMKQAREVRLRLRDVRIKLEKRRKELKKNALREGQAIDAFANIGKQLIEPVEDDLKEKEEYIKRAEEHRLNELQQSRETEIAPFVKNVSHYNVREMDEDEFQELKTSLEEAHELQVQAKEKAEAERKKNEEALAKAAALRKELLDTRKKALEPYRMEGTEFLDDDELAALDQGEFNKYLEWIADAYREMMEKLAAEKIDLLRGRLSAELVVMGQKFTTLDGEPIPGLIERVSEMDEEEIEFLIGKVEESKKNEAPEIFTSKHPTNPLTFGFEREDPLLGPKSPIVDAPEMTQMYLDREKLRTDPDEFKQEYMGTFSLPEPEEVQRIRTSFGEIVVVLDRSLHPDEIRIGRPWGEVKHLFDGFQGEEGKKRLVETGLKNEQGGGLKFG